ncbi:MAG: PEP-CTERM sorting domain-containing protein [Planctomycetota bacterium]
MPEGNLFATFVDPVTGAIFSNSTSANMNFVAEFSSFDAIRPLTSNGTHLSTNGFSPGPGFGVAPNFSFDLTLPNPSTFLSFDVVLADDAFDIDILAYDAGGAFIGTYTDSVSGPLFGEDSVNATFTSAATFFEFRPDPNTNQGYDNFRFAVPEPASAGLLTLGATLIARRRRHA